MRMCVCIFVCVRHSQERTLTQEEAGRGGADDAASDEDMEGASGREEAGAEVSAG